LVGHLLCVEDRNACKIQKRRDHFWDTDIDNTKMSLKKWGLRMWTKRI